MNDRRKGVVLLAGFAVLFLIGEIFFVPKTYLVSRFGQALQSPIVFFRSLANRYSLVSQLNALQLENQSLRAQLVELANRPEIVKQNGKRFLSASIFSTYPFNTFDELLVAAGSDEGVLVNRPVLAAEGIFLGQVTAVSGNTSTIKTLFTSGWELPVKIGSEKVDALFVGGRDPKLTLISKKKAVSGGETVLLASREFPAGLTMGSVGMVKENSEGLFLEASLNLPYVPADLSQVLIGLP